MGQSADDLRGLLDRAAANDAAAAAELFALHRDRLRRMILLRLDTRLRGRLDPSESLARYSSVRESRKTGWLTSESWLVIRSGLPPLGRIRQTSMRSGSEP